MSEPELRQGTASTVGAAPLPKMYNIVSMTTHNQRYKDSASSMLAYIGKMHKAGIYGTYAVMQVGTRGNNPVHFIVSPEGIKRIGTWSIEGIEGIES